MKNTVEINASKRLKTFMIVNESYACPANCPYCTAKITKWEASEHDWNILREKLLFLREEGVTFEYLTISGNGEPALMPYVTLKLIREIYDEFKDLFGYGRFQTCGEIFRRVDKWELFKDFSFEITRCDIDPKKNAEILNYFPYDHLDAFKQSDIKFNYVLLKQNYENNCIVDDIKKLADYDNCSYVSAKILNVNTLDENEVTSKFSQWIIDNGIAKSQCDEMVELLSANFKQVEGYDDFYDRYEWDYNGNQILLYARRQDYGIVNVVYYNGKLTDYHFNNIKIVK